MGVSWRDRICSRLEIILCRDFLGRCEVKTGREMFVENGETFIIDGCREEARGCASHTLLCMQDAQLR